MSNINDLWQSFVSFGQHPSEEAKNFGSTLNSDRSGDSFLESIIIEFKRLECKNRRSQIPKNDINFISECISAEINRCSKDTNRILQRVDGYFYWYGQVQQYCQTYRITSKSFEKLRETLLSFLVSIFDETNGQQPNLLTQNKSFLKDINTMELLAYGATIDSTEKLKRFLIICKFVLQIDNRLSDTVRTRQWVEIMSNVKYISISLTEFVDTYLTYRGGFSDFPFGISMLMHLIQQMHPPKTKESSITLFYSLSQKFLFKISVFLTHFKPIFGVHVHKDSYAFEHVAQLLKWLIFNIKSGNDIGLEYISEYANNATEDDFWNMFLYLYETGEMNETVRQHLNNYARKKILSVSIHTFQQYMQLAKQSLEKIRAQSKKQFLEASENIFDDYINQIMQPSYQRYQVTRTECKDLLEIGLNLSNSMGIERESILFLAHRAVFAVDPSVLNSIQKLVDIFRNLNLIDAKLCSEYPAEKIIQDDWLSNYLIIHIDIWLKMDRNTYDGLSSDSQRHPWASYVWSRICYLSIPNMITNKKIEALSKISQWMETVQHHIYSSTDTLTIILMVNLFELVLERFARYALLVPNMSHIFNYIIAMKQHSSVKPFHNRIETFLKSVIGYVEELLRLDGKYLSYTKPSMESNILCFIPLVDLRTVFQSVDPVNYRFPSMNQTINDIVGLPKPDDIEIENIETNQKFLQQLTRTIIDWFRWFDRFIEIFQNIIDWLKNYNVEDSNKLFEELMKIRDIKNVVVIQTRMTIAKVLKALETFNNLHRLCYSLNCLLSFQVFNPAILSTGNDVQKFLMDTKRLQPSNTLTVDPNNTSEQTFTIEDRQDVRWFLISENNAVNVIVQFIIPGFNQRSELLYEDALIHRNVLHGRFLTQRQGQLIFKIKNSHATNSQSIWYRIKINSLPPCHLFNGIFKMFFDNNFDKTSQIIQQNTMCSLLDQVFKFIDKLLSGDVTLQSMKKLQSVFFDKNINIREEVKKLHFNLQNEAELVDNNSSVDQVCLWLRTYQYYTHINVIMKCIEHFDLLPADNDKEIIGNLKLLSDDNNCLLKDINLIYQILQDFFETLTHQHLQLIKTAVECANVIHMMKKADLYSTNGQRRFQEMRDNLTTQFQMQELNNTILNAWIFTYDLIKPFVSRADNFGHFIQRLANVKNLEETSLNYIKVVKDNLQIVTLWLTADETTVLDNALITMEHLYRTASVQIHLRRLVRKASFYEVSYSIDRFQDEANNVPDGEQNENRTKVNIPFIMSMSEVDDHKRQLTFCNVETQQNSLHRKSMIDGQLRLLKTVEQIYDICKKLELVGHPDYQLRDQDSGIQLQLTLNSTLLTNGSNYNQSRLKEEIANRIEGLKRNYRTMQSSYDKWIKSLEDNRQQCPWLKLFNNREIMILIILLRKADSQDSVRVRFLKSLFNFKISENQEQEEEKLTVLCLQHYFSSVHLTEINLTTENLSRLCHRHQINTLADTNVCLTKLAEFLHELFQDNSQLLSVAPSQKKKQFIVKIERESSHSTSSFKHDLDLTTCSVLLSIFKDRLPSAHQILWCINRTAEEIRLFFSRVRTFALLNFVVMDIDKMEYRLKELILYEQDLLTREQHAHGNVYYFSNELTKARNGLAVLKIDSSMRDINVISRTLHLQFQNQGLVQPQFQIIYGESGMGKTHCINHGYKNDKTWSFSVNDELDLSSLISSFLLFDSKMKSEDPSVFVNVSIHAPFEALTRTMFSLFICGCLCDSESGLVFSLPFRQPWKFIIEVPYSKQSGVTIRANVDKILPILSILASSNLEEVTDTNYLLAIGEEEELVARFYKAFKNEQINRMATEDQNGKATPIEFEKITNADECRVLIYDCMQQYAPDLPENKIYQLSFTKFLYRRVRFFEGVFYCFNTTVQRLGSVAMKQMIEEARALTKLNFSEPDYPSIFLAYDPIFSLRLLHNDWNNVPHTLKRLFKDKDPRITGGYPDDATYFGNCLSWLIDVKYEQFKQVVEQTKFILTENFAYKLFHVHERKLTKLPLIIKGDTGVGKTFLLNFYSLVLNSKVTSDIKQSEIIPKLIPNSNTFILKIITIITEKDPNLLNLFLQQIKPKVLGLNDHDDDIDSEDKVMSALRVVASEEQEQNNEAMDEGFLRHLTTSLEQHKYKENLLYFIYKTTLEISNEKHSLATGTIIDELHQYVTEEIMNYALLDISDRLKELLVKTDSPTIECSMNIFREYLFHSRTKPLFYRLLLHPGIKEEQLIEFMVPILQLARDLKNTEIVVFFDEVNTASCLGLFKEMFMDGTLHSQAIPKNIFFTAAINPFIEARQTTAQVHRTDYVVHQLPQALTCLQVSYGPLGSNTLASYIFEKIKMFKLNSAGNPNSKVALEGYVQEQLADAILKAQQFCEMRLGQNSVSQREIQRCFNLIEFLWNLRYDDDLWHNQKTFTQDPIMCITLSIALIYYFRLPTEEDNLQREDTKTPTREELAKILEESLPGFERTIQDTLERFVNTNNFMIPQGVAINQAIREHVFSTIVSIVTRTPLCIIGAPGQSKTLSFQIALKNLQGPQLSTKSFCKRLPAVDPFFCLGSKYTRSEDISAMFERAIKREHQYQQRKIQTRCVVFLDEASLPDEKKMVLKVLHQYLDDCKVSFVAIANKAFDAANANRMICIYRSLPSEEDQKLLAYGCLGLSLNQNQSNFEDRLNKIIRGLCQSYRKVLNSSSIPHIFHDRDFIYMLRQLRFSMNNLNDNEENGIQEITPTSLLKSLEDNFNGIRSEEFDHLLDIFAQTIGAHCPEFRHMKNERKKHQSNIVKILRRSLNLKSKARRLYGRYKLIIDESEDDTAIRLLQKAAVFDSDRGPPTIFRMSDFHDDIGNELKNIEMLSDIKLCMETGKTIIMINTGRIHGSLYDVFNQNFSVMSTEESRKIFSKVVIGPKTIDVVIHEDFQCIVHVKCSEFAEIPAPFLSRFQKYSVSASDFYSTQLMKISNNHQHLLKTVEDRARKFIEHFGKEYFYGFNEETLFSSLLLLIKEVDENDCSLVNLDENYNQLTIRSKQFVDYRRDDDECRYLSFIISKLLQLTSPEALIVRWPGFHYETAQALRREYFDQQEHLDLRNCLNRLILIPKVDVVAPDSQTTDGNSAQLNHLIYVLRKLVIFTRTSSFIAKLHSQSRYHSSNNDDEHLTDLLIPGKIHLINLSVIDDSSRMKEEIEKFKQNSKQLICLILVDGRINQQRTHIPYIRYLIDMDDLSMNESLESSSRFFVILIHSSSPELNHKSCFPSIFLHGWDFWYVDTSTPGSSIHLKEILKLLTANKNSSGHQDIDNESSFDLNIIFDECLEEFCARLEIASHKTSLSNFQNQNPDIYKFYLNETSANERFQILQTIFQRFSHLQKLIIKVYHEGIAKDGKSLNQSQDELRRMAKDTLSGKSFDSVVDSLEAHVRSSFSNFVSFTLNHIVNDYGLYTLSKLSDGNEDFAKLLSLVDYSSLNLKSANRNIPMRQVPLRFVAHYSYNPQTPLFNLLRQRIEALIIDIKLRLSQEQSDVTENIDEVFLEPDYAQEIDKLPRTTFIEENNTRNDLKDNVGSFRTQLVQLLSSDSVLSKVISPSIVESYSKDLVRSLCSIVEKNFSSNPIQNEAIIDFICRWAWLTDGQDKKPWESLANQEIWQLAQIHSSLEYEQNDLFSLYSACQITENLDENQLPYSELLADQRITRSSVLRKLFQSIFPQLWTRLCKLCQNQDDVKGWIYSYTFISKYHPSKSFLDQSELVEMKVQIEFMNLAYLILLNCTTPEPMELIKAMMNNAFLTDNNTNEHHLNFQGNTLIEMLPIIIQAVDQHFTNQNIRHDTLMIDIQQWVISTLKSSRQSPKDQIIFLLKFLKKPSFHLSLAMKQFLFDGLVVVMMEMVQKSHFSASQQFKDFWDRVQLLTIIIECVVDDDLSEYRLPYHPSVITNDRQNNLLIDLFFFHLRQQANEENNNLPLLIDKILKSQSPRPNNPQQVQSIKAIHDQLQTYFFIQSSASFISQQDPNHADERSVNNILSTLIKDCLKLTLPITTLTEHIQLFCSIVIKKRSLNFLLNLLKSDQFQRVNSNWANNLHDILQSTSNVQRSKSVQLCHQLHFTLSTDVTLSFFPHLHQPYNELNQLIKECVQNNDQAQRWTSLTNWIQSKLNESPLNVNAVEIKVMLLLIIYYDYYCNDQLGALDQLLDIISNSLEPSNEERKVFLVFLNPEQNMIGYTRNNNPDDKNYLNELFNLRCQDEDELPIRHILVNLLAMILLSGKDNFLWTFAFEPLTLQNTFGFGSTRHEPVQAQYVHYDCGCVIHETGALQHFPNSKGNGSPLAVPSVYVVYMATFGAMAWHLLLFDQSVNNLRGPVLAISAIDATDVTARMAGGNLRGKVCHFVRARLLSVYNFLSIHSGQEDACLLFNRCFEQYAQFSRQQEQHPWIQSHYRKFDEKFQAEKEFQDKVFYSVYQNLAEHKKIIGILQAQNQIQSDLLTYSARVPILIGFNHFRTEISNPRSADLPLKTLQRFLGSLEFLKITHYIYSLCEFHLLLHGTFDGLIEEKELSKMTLRELYDRARQLLKIDQNNHLDGKYWAIIKNGIKAVNTYHKFADGLIRPGPCDLTQNFQPISDETPLNYLVRTENEDEGNIVARILSVLIDFHNSLVELLRSEIETNRNNLGLGPLEDIIINLSERKIPILQIAESKLGVISIDETDYRWIEQLARATLENENNYFLASVSSLNFQFLYFQTYLIRTYLLYCPINYTHFEGKYQCRVQARISTVAKPHSDNNNSVLDGSNLDQLNYLKFQSLDRLRNEFEFIQRLKTVLDVYPQDCSTMALSEFVQRVNDDHRLTQQYEKYQIKDFRLSKIKDVYEYYQQAIIRVQNAYNHVSSTIDIPMSNTAIADLDRVLVESFLFKKTEETKEELEGKMRVITDFLEELKEVQEDLARQSSKPFASTCHIWGLESLILGLIPAEVKCENYVPLCVKLIEVRSQLQEKSIAIQERNEEQFTLYPISSEIQTSHDVKNQHEVDNMIPTETEVEKHNSNVDVHQHLTTSSSTFRGFDDDEDELTDLVQSHSPLEDSEMNNKKQKDFMDDQNNFRDFDGNEDILKDSPELPSTFGEIDENNPEYLAQYRIKSDDSSIDEHDIEHVTYSHSNTETPDIEEDEVRNLDWTQLNLQSFNEHHGQHEDPVQLTLSAENDKRSENGTQLQPENRKINENETVEEFIEYPQLHLPHLFKSKLRLITLQSSAVFEKTQDIVQKLHSQEVAKSFKITFVDGTTENKLSGGREKIYNKLKTAFDEKRYSRDSMAIVDSFDLFVDHSKVVADGFLPRVDAAYRVVKKTALISIKINFEDVQYHYQATELANLSSILAQLITDNKLTFNHPENYFSVFDAFGCYIVEDCPLNELYKLDNSSSIDIRMVRCDKHVQICEMSHVSDPQNANKVKRAIDNFHLTTKWQQVGIRLNLFTLNTVQSISNVYIWDTTKNIIINGDEQISSSFENADSIDILVLEENEVMSTALSYDQTNINILIPKHCSLHHLLRNPIYLDQLNLVTSSSDYFLVLISADSVSRVFTKDEMNLPIGNFQSDKIRFQISILIEVFLCGEQKTKSVPISHRNFTVQQLLGVIGVDEDFTYLASYETKSTLPLNFSLSNIPDTKFFLARENQIGHLRIKGTSTDEELNQQYLLNATIDDVYKQNKIDEKNQFLRLDGDFVPSRQTSLNLFLSRSKTTSVVFTIINEKLAVSVTVIDINGDRSISFQCSRSILALRLVEIVCNLWKLKQRFYRLKTANETFLDDEDSIADYDTSADDLQLTLETKTGIKCNISYQGRAISLPTDDDIQASTILEEALETFCIPFNQMNHYGLFLVNDSNNPVRFESNDSIEELRDILGENSENLRFELQTIQHSNDD